MHLRGNLLRVIAIGLRHWVEELVSSGSMRAQSVSSRRRILLKSFCLQYAAPAAYNASNNKQCVLLHHTAVKRDRVLCLISGSGKGPFINLKTN